jgi:ABC-type transport system involved in Fe-S cluster assembly fused permease/ATPase subunit
MGWIAFILLQFLFVAAGVRREQRAGLWSWSKFFFALAFAALESLILFVPIYYVGINSRYFGWTYALAGTIAALNFIWFIIVCRRWRLPDGRTSLEAARQEQQQTQDRK